MICDLLGPWSWSVVFHCVDLTCLLDDGRYGRARQPDAEAVAVTASDVKSAPVVGFPNLNLKSVAAANTVMNQAAMFERAVKTLLEQSKLYEREEQTVGHRQLGIGKPSQFGGVEEEGESVCWKVGGGRM